MKILVSVCHFLFLITGSGMAQSGPAPFTSQTLLFTGGTLHIGDGRVIASGILAIRDKQIVFAGAAGELPDEMRSWSRIDATDRQIYPGLIALNTQLGLNEIEAVNATHDYNETGGYTPNVRAIIAYNTDSKVIPTLRSNGILLAETAPVSGTISGRSALVQLDAWNWEDALVQDDAGMHITWPGAGRPMLTDAKREKERLEASKKQIDQLTEYFYQALAYSASPGIETNLMLEALAGAMKKHTRFFFHAQNARDIQEAVLFIKKFNLKGVIVSDDEVVKLLDLLAREKIPVVLTETHSLPNTDDSPVDQPFTAPGKLKNAGILYAISVSGFWQVRNLAFQAGQAVPYGIDREEALTAITANPARILGIYDRMGSLEAGKDATFFICSGDILDMRNARVETAYIQGRLTDLDNKQKELYRRYMDRYKRK